MNNIKVCEFELGYNIKIEITVSNQKQGIVKVNTLTINEKLLGWIDNSISWQGKYFNNQSMSIKAIPSIGYRFDHWEGNIRDEERKKATLNLKLAYNINLKAIFKKEEIIIPKLFINEIMASNKTAFEDENCKYGDWIEIFNPTDKKIDMAGMYVTDDLVNPGKYKIPYGMVCLTSHLSPRNLIWHYLQMKKKVVKNICIWILS